MVAARLFPSRHCHESNILLMQYSMPIYFGANGHSNARINMTTAQSIQPQRRMALLLNWRNNGFARPHYGLVDDEELLRTGRALFLSTDGRLLPVTRNDLLLLHDTVAPGSDARIDDKSASSFSV